MARTHSLGRAARMYMSRMAFQAEQAGEGDFPGHLLELQIPSCCLSPTSGKGNVRVCLHSCAPESPAQAREAPQNVRPAYPTGCGEEGLPEPGLKG